MSLVYRLAHGTTSAIAGNTDIRRLFWDRELNVLKVRGNDGTIRAIGPTDLSGYATTSDLAGYAKLDVNNVFDSQTQTIDVAPSGTGSWNVVLLAPVSADPDAYAFRLAHVAADKFAVFQDGRVYTAEGYYGPGPGLTDIPVTGIDATGTPSSTTYLRGDGAWVTLSFGTGTVTSVAVSGSTGLSVSGSPITSSGTIVLTLAANLQAIAGLTSSADKGMYFTGAGTAATFDLTAAGRALANIPGTADTFAYFAALNTVAMTTITAGGRALVNNAGTADTFPYFSAANTAALASISAGGRALVNTTAAADKLPYYSGTGTATTTDLTSFARTILDDANEAAARTTVGVTRAAAAGGRLTLTSGTAVTATDVTAASTLYYTPCTHNTIALYNGTRWVPYEFTERSLILSGLTSGTNYDVFMYDNGGTLTLEVTAWTNDTTRATALTRQDGILVKSGAPTRRYLGTFRATGTTTTEDSDAKRFVWNAENRRPRRLFFNESTSHTYGTATWREWRGGTGGPHRVEFVAGLAEDAIDLVVSGDLTPGSAVLGLIGTGLDSTTVPSFSFGHASAARLLSGRPTKVPPQLGYHYFSLMEFANGASVTFTNGWVEAILSA